MWNLLSAIQQAANMVEEVQRMSRIRCTFVHLLTAYNKVWRKDLLHKVREHPFSIWILKTLRSWLTGRYFRRTQLSSWKSTKESLPQGSPLSPCLYNLFVSDLPGTRLFQFAEDTAFLTTSSYLEKCKSKMEKAFTKVEKYSDTWKISLNQQKTKSKLSISNSLTILKGIDEPTAFYGQEVTVSCPEKTKKKMFGKQTTPAEKMPWFLNSRLLREDAKLRDVRQAAEERRTALTSKMQEHEDGFIQRMGLLITLGHGPN